MVFKAFCDEKRLAVLDLLRSGEKCACVLIDKMEIGQSSLSYHMKILCESGIVVKREANMLLSCLRSLQPHIFTKCLMNAATEKGHLRDGFSFKVHINFF